MRGWLALTLFLLVTLFALTRYDPDAGNHLVIDEPDALMHAAAGSGLLEVCEKRELPGPKHTLNPHAPPAKRRQERILVCVETLPDGRLPPVAPIMVTTVRKIVSIA